MNGPFSGRNDGSGQGKSTHQVGPIQITKNVQWLQQQYLRGQQDPWHWGLCRRSPAWGWWSWRMARVCWLGPPKQVTRSRLSSLSTLSTLICWTAHVPHSKVVKNDTSAFNPVGPISDRGPIPTSHDPDSIIWAIHWLGPCQALIWVGVLHPSKISNSDQSVERVRDYSGLLSISTYLKGNGIPCTESKNVCTWNYTRACRL